MSRSPSLVVTMAAKSCSKSSLISSIVLAVRSLRVDLTGVVASDD